MDHLKHPVSLFTAHEHGLANLGDIVVVMLVIYSFLAAVKRWRCRSARWAPWLGPKSVR